MRGKGSYGGEERERGGFLRLVAPLLSPAPSPIIRLSSLSSLSPPLSQYLCVLLQEEDLKDAILLLMANKQDMRGALNAAQLSEAMGLATLKNRQWSIQETSATQGKGLFEGFDWLVQVIQARK